MSFGVGSLGGSSSSINSQIEHQETERMRPNVVSNQESIQRAPSLFQWEAYKPNELLREEVIVGPKGDWMECDPTDPLRCKVRLVFENGMQFLGSLRNGEPQGTNRIVFPNKSWIEGVFNSKLDLILQFPIKMSYSNGDVFKGTVFSLTDDFEIEGRGELFFSNGSWIEGTFYGRRSVGKASGKIIFENGSTFTGALFDGKPHGGGMVSYQDKGWFLGKFDEAGLVLTEPVNIYFDRGDRFEGFISSMDKIEGKGKVTFANGDWIEGTFDETSHVGEGRGEVTLREGVKFRGPLQSGQPFGRGTIIFENGISNKATISSIEGEFDPQTNLVLTNDVIINYIGGSQFKGEVSSDWIQGRGILHFPNGNWIEGGFVDGGNRVKIERWRIINEHGVLLEGSRSDLHCFHDDNDEIIDSDHSDAETEAPFDESAYSRNWDLKWDENPFDIKFSLDTHFLHAGNDQIIDSNHSDAEREAFPSRSPEENAVFDMSHYIGRDWDLE